MLVEDRQLVRLRKKLILQDRQFIELKMIRDYVGKWIVIANERFSQRPKIYVNHAITRF